MSKEAQDKLQSIGEQAFDLITTLLVYLVLAFVVSLTLKRVFAFDFGLINTWLSMISVKIIRNLICRSSLY